MGRAHEVRKASMAKSAALKSALFGRAAKEIYMATKAGSSDPNANLALRSAIDKAKINHVPSDVINRAIKRADGGEIVNYVSNRYEGYGPENSMIIVESLTNNVNRAIAEIRDVFNKNGGKISQAGSVSHNFIPCSVFVFDKKNSDEILEKLLESDCEVIDIFEDDDLTFVYGGFSSFNNIKKNLNDLGIIDFQQAETILKAKDEMTINNQEAIEKFEKLIDRLNELEDVQNLYHNVVLN